MRFFGQLLFYILHTTLISEQDFINALENKAYDVMGIGINTGYYERWQHGFTISQGLHGIR
jgi:allophanate hydrolase subunit 1